MNKQNVPFIRSEHVLKVKKNLIILHRSNAYKFKVKKEVFLKQNEFFNSSNHVIKKIF